VLQSQWDVCILLSMLGCALDRPICEGCLVVCNSSLLVFYSQSAYHWAISGSEVVHTLVIIFWSLYAMLSNIETSFMLCWPVLVLDDIAWCLNQYLTPQSSCGPSVHHLFLIYNYDSLIDGVSVHTWAIPMFVSEFHIKVFWFDWSDFEVIEANILQQLSPSLLPPRRQPF